MAISFMLPIRKASFLTAVPRSALTAASNSMPRSKYCSGSETFVLMALFQPGCST